MVMFALALVGILAMVGLVIDGGYLYVQRRTAQSAADAAALAGTANCRARQANSTARLAQRCAAMPRPMRSGSARL